MAGLAPEDPSSSSGTDGGSGDLTVIVGPHLVDVFCQFEQLERVADEWRDADGSRVSVVAVGGITEMSCS
jgi:hypothetical protein